MHVDKFVTIDYDAEYVAFLAVLSALSVAMSTSSSIEVNDVEVLETVMSLFCAFPTIIL